MKFQMGEYVKDIITGLEGFVMGYTVYHTGCTHYGILRSKLKEDGDIPDWVWLDSSRLRSLGQTIKLNTENDSNTYAKLGGPFPNPPSV